jgi:hypothetical protein
MALQLALDESQTEMGTPAPAAYARIVQYSHDLKNDIIQIVVEFHYNQQARNQGRRPLKGAGYSTNDAAVMVFPGGIQAKLYSYLKTLPEFAGATDV